MVAILDMPESPAELAGWLDQVLMSDDLAVVVDELSVVHQSNDEVISVEQARDWLGDSFPAVMERGLGAIGRSRLRQLLVRPRLLPAIQELALVSGGPYWNQLICNVPIAEAAPVVGRASPRKRSNNRWLLAFVPLAVAASVAAFVAIDAGRDESGIKTLPHSDLNITRGTGGDIHSQDTPWGWNRTDLLAGINSPGGVPTRLADTLSEWFELSGTLENDVESFKLRVNEMWAGCEQLSTESFTGMSGELQESIQDRINTFQRELDEVLRILDGPIPTGKETAVLSAARKSVDDNVRKTVESLRNLE
jgi:hypothetical protein